MGNGGAKSMGMEQAPMTVDDSVGKIVRLLDTATRESHGGKYWNLDDDKELPW